jgi:hypothetical protein
MPADSRLAVRQSPAIAQPPPRTISTVNTTPTRHAIDPSKPLVFIWGLPADDKGHETSGLPPASESTKLG